MMYTGRWLSRLLVCPYSIAVAVMVVEGCFPRACRRAGVGIRRG